MLRHAVLVLVVLTLSGLESGVELDEELVVRVAQLALVDPRRERCEEWDGQRREQS